MTVAVHMLEKEAYSLVGVVLETQKCHEVVVGHCRATVYGAVFAFSYGSTLYNIQCVTESVVSSPSLDKVFAIIPCSGVKAAVHRADVAVIERLFVGILGIYPII